MWCFERGRSCDCRRCWSRLSKKSLRDLGWFEQDPAYGLAKVAFFGYGAHGHTKVARDCAALLYGVRWHGRAKAYFAHYRVSEAYRLADEWPETKELGHFASYFDRAWADYPKGRFGAFKDREQEARRAVDGLATSLARYVWNAAGSGWDPVGWEGAAAPLSVIVASYELGGVAAVEALVGTRPEASPSRLFAEFTAEV